MKAFLAKVKKALVAGAVPFGGYILANLGDGVTADEWWKALGLGVAAGLAVFGVKNAPWKADAK